MAARIRNNSILAGSTLYLSDRNLGYLLQPDKEAVYISVSEYEKLLSRNHASGSLGVEGLGLDALLIYSEEKTAAVVLSKTLKSALEKFKSGCTNLNDIISFTKTEIAKEPLANIEYVECYGLPGLYELKEEITAPALLAVAVRFGTTRLIDNIILE